MPAITDTPLPTADDLDRVRHLMEDAEAAVDELHGCFHRYIEAYSDSDAPMPERLPDFDLIGRLTILVDYLDLLAETVEKDAKSLRTEIVWQLDSLRLDKPIQVAAKGGDGV